MALNTQIRATCLLLLVLLSLTSGSVLPPQVRAQGPELQQPLGDDCGGQWETPSMGRRSGRGKGVQAAAQSAEMGYQAAGSEGPSLIPQ